MTALELAAALGVPPWRIAEWRRRGMPAAGVHKRVGPGRPSLRFDLEACRALLRTTGRIAGVSRA